MLHPDAKLAANIFDNPAAQTTREGFGRGVVEAGEQDERVVVLTADLAESTFAHYFQKKFPERFVQVGVAEQNMATVAAGMANYGKIPFFTSYATFSPGRNWARRHRDDARASALHCHICMRRGGGKEGDTCCGQIGKPCLHAFWP